MCGRYIGEALQCPAMPAIRWPHAYRAPHIIPHMSITTAHTLPALQYHTPAACPTHHVPHASCAPHIMCPTHHSPHIIPHSPCAPHITRHGPHIMCPTHHVPHSPCPTHHVPHSPCPTHPGPHIMCPTHRLPVHPIRILGPSPEQLAHTAGTHEAHELAAQCT